MQNAIDVARVLVHVGYDPENRRESSLITNLRLQKYLYYCQGWSLGLLGQPLFTNHIQAWKSGPVVREVYHAYKGHGGWAIPPSSTQVTVNTLTKTETDLIRAVWKHYSSFTPHELVALTHTETPWLNARKGLDPESRSTRILSLEDMRDYFSKLAGQFKYHGSFPGLPGIPVTDAWRIELEAELHPESTSSSDVVYQELLKECVQ